MLGTDITAGDSRLLRCGDALDRLMQDLPQCRNASQQVRLALQVVHELLGADFVFWYPPLPQGRVDAVGTWKVTPEWCQNLVEENLAACPNMSEFCRSTFSSAAQAPLHAASVVMVQYSKMRSPWMVAVAADSTRRFGKEDVKLACLVRRLLLQERQRARTVEKLHSTLLGLVRCLTEAINAKNPYTCEHSERVARIAVRLARQMDLPPAVQSALYLGGLLHDVGKVGIDTDVLKQTGPLTDEQRTQIQAHPVIGDRILSEVPSLSHLRPAVRNHHERYDGKGYPDGLQGEAIPLLARVIAVADACDAMFSPRPYRPGMSAEMVEATFAAGAGTQWDPNIIQHFFDCRLDLFAIYKKGLGDSVEKAIMDTVSGGAGI